MQIADFTDFKRIAQIPVWAFEKVCQTKMKAVINLARQQV